MIVEFFHIIILCWTALKVKFQKSTSDTVLLKEINRAGPLLQISRWLRVLHMVVNLDSHTRCIVTLTLTLFLKLRWKTDSLMCHFTLGACDVIVWRHRPHFFILSQHDSGVFHFTSCSATVFEVIKSLSAVERNWWLRRSSWLLQEITPAYSLYPFFLCGSTASHFSFHHLTFLSSTLLFLSCVCLWSFPPLFSL